MIEDMTDWDEVKEGECFTTGIVTSDMIDDSLITEFHYIDSNGNEWEIMEMEATRFWFEGRKTDVG